MAELLSININIVNVGDADFKKSILLQLTKVIQAQSRGISFFVLLCCNTHLKQNSSELQYLHANKSFSLHVCLQSISSSPWEQSRSPSQYHILGRQIPDSTHLNSDAPQECSFFRNGSHSTSSEPSLQSACPSHCQNLLMQSSPEAPRNGRGDT